MDYDVERPSRTCASTGRALNEGETIFSAVVADEGELRRLDFAAEAWTGPPAGAVGWWRSRIPEKQEQGPKLAPNEVLWQLFQQLEERPEQQDLRFVLGLLLVRRRWLRLDGIAKEPEGEFLELFYAGDQQVYRVPSQSPSPERSRQIEQQLGEVLFAR